MLYIVMKNYRGFCCLREQEKKNLDKKEDAEKLPSCPRYNICYLVPFHKC